MSWDSAFVLVVSTLGLVLIGYVVLTAVFRALSHPSLLLPGMRSRKIAELQAKGDELLSERLSSEDRHVVERAMNTLRIPNASSLSGPWSKSDPITDAEQDVQSVWNRVKGSNS